MVKKPIKIDLTEEQLDEYYIQVKEIADEMGLDDTQHAILSSMTSVSLCTDAKITDEEVFQMMEDAYDKVSGDITH